MAVRAWGTTKSCTPANTAKRVYWLNEHHGRTIQPPLHAEAKDNERLIHVPCWLVEWAMARALSTHWAFVYVFWLFCLAFAVYLVIMIIIIVAFVLVWFFQDTATWTWNGPGAWVASPSAVFIISLFAVSPSCSAVFFYANKGASCNMLIWTLNSGSERVRYVKSCIWFVIRMGRGIHAMLNMCVCVFVGISMHGDPDFWSVIQAVGGDNCYESNFWLSITLLSSIPTSIYTKNVFHQILGSGFWLMSLLCSVRHHFTT